MKPFALILAGAALVVLLDVGDANAQSFGYSNSSTFSDNFSSNWGRSTGFGPGGFVNQGYDFRQGLSNFNSSQSVFSPFGGASRATELNSGFRQHGAFSRGFSPSMGIFDNRSGGFDGFRNGNRFATGWSW